MNRRRVVRVPASSANLGPGFDVLAGALSLTLTVEVTETGTFAVETDLDVPTDKENLIVRAFETLHSADDFTFRVTAEAPLTGGLGSSASAILAGVAAADHIFELGTDLLLHAGRIEGHLDNLAASLHGGFVVCAGGAVTRIEPPNGLEAIVAIPPAGEPVTTSAARAALPDAVLMAETVATIGTRRTLFWVLNAATGICWRLGSLTCCTSRVARICIPTQPRWFQPPVASALWGRQSLAPARPF